MTQEAEGAPGWRRGPVVIHGPLQTGRPWWLVPVIPAVIGGLLYVGVESAASLAEWGLKRVRPVPVVSGAPSLPPPAPARGPSRPGRTLRRPLLRAGALPSTSSPGTAAGALDAVVHWNSGIIYFQKGDLEKARDEWKLCSMLDPANEDCRTGLQRIDQQFGSP